MPARSVAFLARLPAQPRCRRLVVVRRDADRLHGRGEHSSEVYVLEVATGATTQVTKNAYAEGVPAWSPDGRRLVVSRRAGPMDTLCRIVSASATGGDERTVRQRAREPVWSSAGTELAFTNLAPPRDFVVAGAAGPATAGADGSMPRLPCTIDGAEAGRWRMVFLPGAKKEIRYWQSDGTDRNDVICGTSRNDLILPGKGNGSDQAHTDARVDAVTNVEQAVGPGGQPLR